MKIRTVIGLTGATAASVVGMAGLAAGPAGAGGNGAVNMPAGELTGYLATNYGDPVGVPILAPLVDPLQPGAMVFPNDKMTGNCDPAAMWLFQGILALDFRTGNAVVYQGQSNPIFPFLPGGLNAIGTAELDTIQRDSQGHVTGMTPTGYIGTAHAWMGQGANANGQAYGGETFTFNGTNGGSTISFTLNPGFIQSAGQNPNGPHQGGWGQQNLNCNIGSGG